MNEEYLWNRSGEPDTETARLERLLAPLRYREPAPVRPGRNVAWWLAGVAAAVALVCIPLLQRAPMTAWKLASGSGLRAGQWVETGGSGSTRIESAQTGAVEIDAGSRVRVLAASAGEEHLNLQQGTIHALIWAPPGRFVVDTPSAKTIDLGCRYTLQVGDGGVGLLTVEAGWVAFESKGTESFIPEGAACVTRPVSGPGTPYFSDAMPALISALARFDTARDAEALGSALASLRRRDALTSWHLLTRTRGEQRAQVFDRFAALVALPPAVTRQAMLDGDPAAFDAAWNALDLGDTAWWREWKRKW